MEDFLRWCNALPYIFTLQEDVSFLSRHSEDVFALLRPAAALTWQCVWDVRISLLNSRQLKNKIGTIQSNVGGCLLEGLRGFLS